MDGTSMILPVIKMVVLLAIHLSKKVGHAHNKTFHQAVVSLITYKAVHVYRTVDLDSLPILPTEYVNHARLIVILVQQIKYAKVVLLALSLVATFVYHLLIAQLTIISMKKGA